MRFSLSTAIMLMFAFSTARKDTLLMHSSVTVKDGKAYLFLGKSGTGKSTHSQVWINHVGGGKTPCYRNLSYPVGAIVDLHQAHTNHIHRQSMIESFASMYVSFSGYRFIKEMADGLHATNVKVISAVPCYSLDCLPNAEAAWLCYNTVAQ